MTAPRTKTLEVKRKIENHFCLGADRLYSESGGCCPQRPPHGYSSGSGKNWFTDQYQQQAAREIVKVHCAAADCLWWWSGKCAQVPTLLTYNICARHARNGKQEVSTWNWIGWCPQNILEKWRTHWFKTHKINTKYSPMGDYLEKIPVCQLRSLLLYWITLSNIDKHR